MARRPRHGGGLYGGHRRPVRRARRWHPGWYPYAYVVPQVVAEPIHHYDFGNARVTTQVDYDRSTVEEAIFNPATACAPVGLGEACRRMTAEEKRQLWLQRQRRKLLR